MAEIPTSSKWKAFLKAHPKADEGALAKALDRFHRADADDPAALADVLEEVVDQAEAAKKKNAKNKEVAGYLNDLIDDAEKARAKAIREAKEQPDDEEEDAEAGAALRSGLVRAKKLDAEKAAPFVLALGAVAGMVIARRPPLTKDHRTTAKEMRTGKGKLLYGRCYGEDGKYIFEFDDVPAGGLTKVIKKAAKVHAGLDIRLKVRGGGRELDDEADTAEMTDFGAEADETESSTTTATEGTTGTADQVDPLVEKLRPRIAGVVATWEQARATAAMGVDDLSGRLRGTGDPDAVRAADVVEDLSGEFPDGLDAALDDLREALDRNDAAAVGPLCTAAQVHVKDCLKYLKANQTLIGHCENNEFGARVSISQPLVKALQDVLAGLK